MPTIIITFLHGFTLMAGVLAAVLSGCVRLPEYAMPISGRLLGDASLLADAFTYRRLARADFQAAALPPDRAGHAASINARACIQTRKLPCSTFPDVSSGGCKKWSGNSR